MSVRFSAHHHPEPRILSDATAATTGSPRWPLWQRIAFRFTAALFAQLIPLRLLLPWIPPLQRLLDSVVQLLNARVLHVAPVLVEANGSGDTSWEYTFHALVLIVSVLATALWSLLDARRPSYPRAAYWLRTILRYKLASAAIVYGIIKVFALQMTFPSLSQLSTPLGDLLPMRFSWLFIGYSTTYQVFCGVMEFVAGTLLLFRRTVTLGLILSAAAFTNVVLINLAYDVPVKLYSSQLLLICVVLLAWDAPRLVRLLVLNQPAGGTTLYDPPPEMQRWQTYARRGLKAAMVVLVLVLPVINTVERGMNTGGAADADAPLPIGIYAVRHFIVNGDTLAPSDSSGRRWNDLIIDNERGGSIGTTDTTFWQRYGRGYFRYATDTATRTITIWRTSVTQDSTFILAARYSKGDSTTVTLRGRFGADSLTVELGKRDRHFQLAERQFHWLSEYNR